MIYKEGNLKIIKEYLCHEKLLIYYEWAFTNYFFILGMEVWY